LVQEVGELSHLEEDVLKTLNEDEIISEKVALGDDLKAIKPYPVLFGRPSSPCDYDEPEPPRRKGHGAGEARLYGQPKGRT